MNRKEKKLKKLKTKLACYQGRYKELERLTSLSNLITNGESHDLVVYSGIISSLKIKITNLEREVGSLIMKDMGVKFI